MGRARLLLRTFVANLKVLTGEYHRADRGLLPDAPRGCCLSCLSASVGRCFSPRGRGARSKRSHRHRWTGGGRRPPLSRSARRCPSRWSTWRFPSFRLRRPSRLRSRPSYSLSPRSRLRSPAGRHPWHGSNRRRAVRSRPRTPVRPLRSRRILVLSLKALGALAPLGAFLSALPTVLVAPALALIMGVGFVVGITSYRWCCCSTQRFRSTADRPRRCGRRPSCSAPSPRYFSPRSPAPSPCSRG